MKHLLFHTTMLLSPQVGQDLLNPSAIQSSGSPSISIRNNTIQLCALLPGGRKSSFGLLA